PPRATPPGGVRRSARSAVRSAQPDRPYAARLVPRTPRYPGAAGARTAGSAPPTRRRGQPAAPPATAPPPRAAWRPAAGQRSRDFVPAAPDDVTAAHPPEPDRCPAGSHRTGAPTALGPGRRPRHTPEPGEFGKDGRSACHGHPGEVP